MKQVRQLNWGDRLVWITIFFYIYSNLWICEEKQFVNKRDLKTLVETFGKFQPTNYSQLQVCNNLPRMMSTSSTFSVANIVNCNSVKVVFIAWAKYKFRDNDILWQSQTCTTHYTTLVSAVKEDPSEEKSAIQAHENLPHIRWLYQYSQNNVQNTTNTA